MTKKGYEQTKDHRHNISLAMNGIKRSEKTKKIMSLSKKMTARRGNQHQFFGKHRTKKTRVKISKGMKGKKNSLGSKRTIQSRQKLSKKLIGNKNGLGHKLTKGHIKILKQKRLHQIFPLKDSIPEKMFQIALSLEKISYRKHEPILGQPDIFIKPNICIFVDGIYWHSKFERKINDNKITEKLRNENYEIIRIIAPKRNKDFDVAKHAKEIKMLLKIRKIVQSN